MPFLQNLSYLSTFKFSQIKSVQLKVAHIKTLKTSIIRINTFNIITLRNHFKIKANLN